jgi:septal ring factor EnvC (AmiA/AmiB activator)
MFAAIARSGCSGREFPTDSATVAAMLSPTPFHGRRTPLLVAAPAAILALALVAVLALGAARGTAAPSVGQLQSQLGAQRSQQQRLSSSIGSLNQLIDQLDAQISLVQRREQAVADQLADDRAKLTAVHGQLVAERKQLVQLKAKLAAGRALLAQQLVSGYEANQPTLVSIVLSASGFQDLLNQLNFLGRAEHEQKTLISTTTTAKLRASQAARRLAELESTDRRVTHDALLRQRALAGMNELLQSKQAALGKARAAQSVALEASRERAEALRHEISKVKAQQAAAAAAAAKASAQAAADTALPTPTGPALSADSGWAIPWAIVDCESGGQNFPPNSAGASGYYQIIPSTWAANGGIGPAAYLTSKAEQSAVAKRIWDTSGPGAWDCASIVGIT